MVLSAITEVADKVLLLSRRRRLCTKPFSPRELMARVQAAIRRRRRPAEQTLYRFGCCEVDFARMTVLRNGKAVTLTAHEFKLLKFFTENAERVLTRDVLLNEVWGYNFYPTTRTVDNQILKLRQKLEPDPRSPASAHDIRRRIQIRPMTNSRPSAPGDDASGQRRVSARSAESERTCFW